MKKFSIPDRSELTSENQAIYDKVRSQLGFVPNIYSYLAKHSTALPDYLQFIGRKSTLSGKEREAVSLVVSEINGCKYCQSAHTALGKMNGFTDDEILLIRRNEAVFSRKINALVNLAASLTENRGKASQETIDAFFDAGYTEENFIDLTFGVADKIITNFLAQTAEVKIDFPAVTVL